MKNPARGSLRGGEVACCLEFSSAAAACVNCLPYGSASRLVDQPQIRTTFTGQSIFENRRVGMAAVIQKELSRRRDRDGGQSVDIVSIAIARPEKSRMRVHHGVRVWPIRQLSGTNNASHHAAGFLARRGRRSFAIRSKESSTRRWSSTEDMGVNYSRKTDYIDADHRHSRH